MDTTLKPTEVESLVVLVIINNYEWMRVNDYQWM